MLWPVLVWTLHCLFMSLVGAVHSRNARHISYDHYDDWSINNSMLTASIHHWKNNKKKMYGTLMLRLKKIILAAERSEEEECVLALRQFAQCWCEKHVFACVSNLKWWFSLSAAKTQLITTMCDDNVCVCAVLVVFCIQIKDKKFFKTANYEFNMNYTWHLCLCYII